MENANKELQEDRRKNHYVVETKRETKLMLTFIEFKNRVEHPMATLYMVAMGVMLIGLMYKQADSIAMVGKVIGYIFGAVLTLMGLFRKYKMCIRDSVNKDINCMFPIDRLHELAAEGFIKATAPVSYTHLI